MSNSAPSNNPFAIGVAAVLALLALLGLSALLAWIPPPVWAWLDYLPAKFLLFVVALTVSVQIGMSVYWALYLPPARRLFFWGFSWGGVLIALSLSSPLVLAGLKHAKGQVNAQVEGPTGKIDLAAGGEASFDDARGYGASSLFLGAGLLLIFSLLSWLDERFPPRPGTPPLSSP